MGNYIFRLGQGAVSSLLNLNLFLDTHLQTALGEVEPPTVGLDFIKPYPHYLLTHPYI